MLLCLATAVAEADLCAEWSEPESLGEIDVGLMPEASGMAVATGGRHLYLINDGRKPRFFVTAIDGSDPVAVDVTGFRPLDMEDLALGRCETGRCLYLADIGDNARRRQAVQIAVVAESASFGASVPALRVIAARYPDGAHDAEAIAVLPSGDLWLMTKSPLWRGEPSTVFRLTAAQLSAGGEQVFEPIGKLRVADLGAKGNRLRRVVTAMDVSPDGRRLAVLTYEFALELAIGDGLSFPAEDAWREGENYRLVATAPLVQGESIAFADDGRSLLYTTESIVGSAAPIMRQVCR
jgi:hypothetical protein